MRKKIDSDIKGKKLMHIISKGFCMGIADVIPGISGGTIALIVGIYERLIDSIKTIDVDFLKLVCQMKFKKALDRIAWKFLGSVFIGIISAILLLSKLISWLLDHHPVLIHAFFFGLIVASIPIIAKRVPKWDQKLYAVGILTAFGMYQIVGLVPIETPENLLFIFLCAALAICAMILPGISGAFILLLLGKYHYVINAIHERNLAVIAVFGLGCAAGLLSFVRVLSWLLHKYHDLTITILLGLVLGSLRKIWPWKVTAHFIKDSHGKIIPLEQVNIFPAQLNLETVFAIGLIAAGFFAVIKLNELSLIKEEKV